MRIVVLTAMLMALSAQPGRQPDELFTPAPGCPVKVGPGSGTVMIADLDRDGHADMLTRHLPGRRGRQQFRR
jgi:hypothetical protein